MAYREGNVEAALDLLLALLGRLELELLGHTESLIVEVAVETTDYLRFNDLALSAENACNSYLPVDILAFLWSDEVLLEKAVELLVSTFVFGWSDRVLLHLLTLGEGIGESEIEELSSADYRQRDEKRKYEETFHIIFGYKQVTSICANRLLN